MSSEPERPIEKLLRASARQKPEPPEAWEMPPATRRSLQQEIARRFEAEPQARLPWLEWLMGHGWLRPIAALGSLALLIGMTWLCVRAIVPEHNPSLLAKNEQRPTPNGALENLTRKQTERDLAEPGKKALSDNLARSMRPEQTANPLRESEVAKESSLQKDRSLASIQPSVEPSEERILKQSFDAAAAPQNKTAAAAPQNAPLPSLYDVAQGAFVKTAGSPAGAAVSQLGAPAATGQIQLLSSENQTGAPALSLANPTDAQSVSFAVAQTLSPQPAAVVQYGYFTGSQIRLNDTRNVRGIGGLAPLSSQPASAGRKQSNDQVLVSFRLEQHGREIRLIDSDDSIYSGSLEPTLLQAQTKPAMNYSTSRAFRQTADSRGLKSDSAAAAQCLFTVVGTNRTSNQKVVFSGTLSGDTNVFGVLLDNFEQGARSATADKLSVGPTQNLHVSGKAVIGQDSEIQIEAAPASARQPK